MSLAQLPPLVLLAQPLQRTLKLWCPLPLVEAGAQALAAGSALALGELAQFRQPGEKCHWLWRHPCYRSAAALSILTVAPPHYCHTLKLSVKPTPAQQLAPRGQRVHGRWLLLRAPHEHGHDPQLLRFARQRHARGLRLLLPAQR